MHFSSFLPFLLVGVMAAPMPATEQAPGALEARSSGWGGFPVWDGQDWTSPPPSPPSSPDRSDSPPPSKRPRTG
ncbi:hypothetical protein MCOR27_006802 [Pyricularia oryzae]|uniref:Uncharacterized protein n=2 Tax=Pyricularia TaxID=48558 RepID=A0ABQ8NLC1_PYRGI|nr:hypothetical protein OOU_Y34scaffold01105g2 [Pyricularia oryzae Y34]KAH8841732.1 hypothetical protein MCOR01_005688 [Pyricularia oryzae]KAI6298821.1 hypothetical protein MCOR33_005105 [Pyricularia grisea]KAI6260959.1 hypothetical protein MCOR19_002721 [Pyricularia oryzae]KAI6272488.1 hypothetical protein MCOR26_007340 [Pyricularia oryzae]